MQFLPLPARCRGPSFCIFRAAPFVTVSSLFFLAAGIVENAAIGQAVPPQLLNGRGELRAPADQEVIAGVYLPTDRTLSRAVLRARERLAAHEYQEALAFLHGILGRDEDSFLERNSGERGQLGLKATARQLIGDLPPEGLDAYELLQGPTARRQLEAAMKSGDRNGLAKVVRQFFHTSAGYEATLVLAEMEADQGHRLAAAQLYQELINAPRAASRFEPQLSIAAALNYLAVGQPAEAAATLKSLIEQRPSAEFMLSGKAVTLPALGADPLVWLANLVGEVKASTPSDNNWLTVHGDPSRNAQSPGGEPHLRPRWEARVVNEPAIEAFLTGRTKDFLQRGVVAIPGARPIAIGDIIVMRTPENVVAVDWQTGKRIWETRDEQELDTEDVPTDLDPGMDHEQVAAQGRPLEERMWDDALATSLSSDGSRVFVVRGLGSGRDDDSVPWQVVPGMGRMGGVETAASTNQLAAYDLATQGKLAWELDGARTAGTLAGAFFLGPPVAIDNTLYAMAEIRSALYLLALDPATGRIAWQQQLVGLEQGIAADPSRRRVGATPSYSGGILVCPTGSSAAVAIDVVKREFAWVYRYPREAQSATEARQQWQMQQGQGQLVRANDQWLDNSAIIAENRVLLTPPESAEIHCLDLHTGKQIWKRRQGEALFVGGVDHGTVLLVGSQAVQGIRLADAAPAWKQESVSLPSGALPTGQGYISEGRYFLPLTSGQIAEIEMASGSITYDNPTNPEIQLGNLICHRGSVVSQSPLLLDKFEQLDLLQKRTEAALAQNPKDPSALRELGEIKSAAGEKTEAVRLFKQALELAPDDTVTQEMLVELLLQQLATDYATYKADVPLVSRLAHNRDQQIELLRIDAAGLDSPDNRLAAWEAYLKLSDFTAEEPAYLRIDDRYTVRSDHWISSRLASIWSEASADERKVLAERIAARRPDLSHPHTAAELRHYLAHLGELPNAADVRLSLANFLIERGRLQEAEIQLLQLMTSPEREMQAAAARLLAKANSRPSKQNDDRHVDWPRGHVDGQLIPLTATPQGPSRERPARPAPERQNGYRPLRVEQDYLPSIGAVHWFVAFDSSEIVGRNNLGDDVFHWTVDQNTLARQYRGDSALVHGARLGHLLFVAIGGQVIAIDSRQDSAADDSDILWPTRTGDDLSANAGRSRRALLAAATRTTRPPVYNAWSGRRRIAGAAANTGGSLGPATPRGVAFQDSDELKCVDPLSGAMLWARSDIPVGCELFGDDELVFAADITSHLAYVVRLSDGQLLGKREIPKSEWLLTAGRHVAQLAFSNNQGNRVTTITVTDIWSQETLYEAKFPANARLSVVEPDSIAVLDSAGVFHLINVATGKDIVQQLEPVPDLQAIHTMRSGDDLFLFATAQAQAQDQFKSLGQPSDYPLINGPVYAFNLKTGKPLWPGPALVRNRGVILWQPSDLPLLVFADRQQVRDGNGGGFQLRILCLDKRTGQTVYRNDVLPDTSVSRLRIRGEVDSSPTVLIEMSAGKIQLVMTDRPRPPQPPANDDLEAPRQVVEHGLRGLGQKFGSALRGVFEKGPEPAAAPRPVRPQPRPEVPPKVQPQRPPAQRPDDKVPDTDDD